MKAERIIELRRIWFGSRLQPQTFVVDAKWFNELRDALFETISEIERLQTENGSYSSTEM